MRRMISALILLGLIGVIYFSGYYATKDAVKVEREKLETCISHIKNNEIEKAINTNETKSGFDKLTHYIYKEKIIEIRENINLAYYYLSQNKIEEANIYAQTSLNKLKEIENESLFSIEVLF